MLKASSVEEICRVESHLWDFPKQVVVPRYRGYSLICRAPLAEISIYINYLFNLVLLKQQNRIYNLQKQKDLLEKTHPDTLFK